MFLIKLILTIIYLNGEQISNALGIAVVAMIFDETRVDPLAINVFLLPVKIFTKIIIFNEK